MSYQQTVAGYLRDRERRDMKNELRDVLLAIDGMTGENAKVIAAAIRAEIDERTAELELGIKLFLSDALEVLFLAKPQAAEPRRISALRLQQIRETYCNRQPKENSFGADAIRDLLAEIEARTLEDAEPRRNPYEDFRQRGEGPENVSERDLRELLYYAWNEGAQIAGERDE